MWADVETDSDFLNYSEIAELTAEVLCDPRMRPVSVGIFGTWGTGKSTLLNLVERRLVPEEGEGDFIVVRFDAWRYQGFDDARAALMEVIAAKLVEAADLKEASQGLARRLLKRVDRIRLLGLVAEGGAALAGFPAFGLLNKGVNAVGDLLSGSGDEGDLDDLGKAGKDVEERAKGLVRPAQRWTPPSEIAAFRREFGELIGALGKTLVVFIDNLDRCLPKQTIQTLEALRLFLFMKSTAFVVAADEEMVRNSVTEFFKDVDERHVIDYLDKLVQVPMRLPKLGIQEVRSYLYLQFASVEPSVTSRDVERLRLALEASLRRSWKDEPITTEDAMGHLGATLQEEVKRGFGIADRMAPLLANSTLIQGNPRIAKRLLNVVRMRSRLAKRREMPIDEALIAKLALFERCTDTVATAFLYNAISRAAEGKPEIFPVLEKLLEDPEGFRVECPEALKSRAEFLREWLALDPPLGGVDLRPAVYLSRETVPIRALRSGLSAVAAESLRVLAQTTSASAPSGKAAVAAVPAGEHLAVMNGMVEGFRKHADWTRRPTGFDGAMLLARQDADAGAVLSGFLQGAVGAKLPPWLSVLVKGEGWFAGKAPR